MATPVGHSLIGLTLGILWFLPRSVPWKDLSRVLYTIRWPLFIAIVLGNLPDLDYIPGIIEGSINKYHHYHTHTLGACFLVAVIVWAIWRIRRPETALRAAVIVLLCSFLHVLTDLFCEDQSEPIGVMALWPLTSDRYLAPFALLPKIYKDSWSEVFQWANLKAFAIEAIMFLPLVALAIVWKARPASKATLVGDEPEVRG